MKHWLQAHPEVSEYVILEDLRRNFEGCGEEMASHIVWTDSRHGLQPTHYGEILSKLNPMKEEAELCPCCDKPLVDCKCNQTEDDDFNEPLGQAYCGLDGECESCS